MDKVCYNIVKYTDSKEGDHMKRRILLMVLFMLFLLPFEVEGLREEDIQEKLFKNCTEKSITYTVWSVSWDCQSNIDNVSGTGTATFELGVKRPNGVTDDNLKGIEIKPESFTFDGENVTGATVSDYFKYFANLDVETNNRINCGKLKEKGYEKCNGNDYCNYWCFKAGGNLELLGCSEGECVARDDNPNSTAYFIYDNSGEQLYPGSGQSWTLNRILRGNMARTGDVKTKIAEDELSAITSIQSRSFKLYKSSLKNVNNSKTDFVCRRYYGGLMCYKEVSYGETIDYSKTINLNGKIYDVFTREAGSREKTDDVTSYNTSDGLDQGLGNSFDKKIIKEVEDSKSKYTIWQRNLGACYGDRVYGIPVKFKVTYTYDNCSSCTVKNANVNPLGTECIDGTDEIKENKYVCEYNNENKIEFDLISTDGEVLKGDENKDKINPFCYRNCSTKITTKGLQFDYNSPNANGSAYRAGMGFDWNFSLGYERSCTITIDINKYNNSSDIKKRDWLYNCVNSKAINSSNSVISNVFISNFHYGYMENGSWISDSDGDLQLKSLNNSTLKTSKKCYDMGNSEVNCNYNLEKISRVEYTERTSGDESYTTDQFGCILKGSGKPVKCGSTTAPTVESETTYPIHPQMNSKNGIPITLKINLSNGKSIEKACSYNVINELFGRENDPNDPKTYKNKAHGLDVIYRPISLSNPFPGLNDDGKKRGSNWTDSDVADFITSNRGESSNEIYTKKSPLYRIELNASKILKIREYNKKNKYGDFNYGCDENGLKCIATNKNILRNSDYELLDTDEGTCRQNDEGRYYTCADKNENSGGEIS